MFTNWGCPLFPMEGARFRIGGGSGDAPAEPDGICEVITVPAMDELPYAFELESGQVLDATITSEQPFGVLLCDDAIYEEWIDQGMLTPLPESFHLYQASQTLHIVSFSPTQRGHYILLLVNPLASPIEAVFNARTS